MRNADEVEDLASGLEHVLVVRRRVRISSPNIPRRQYVNLPADQDDSFGRVVEVQAQVTPATAGVDVHWSFMAKSHFRNGLGESIKAGFTTNRFWSLLNYQVTDTAVSTTNSLGVATIKFRVSQYGGDRFIVSAGLTADDMTTDSGELRVWRRIFYQISHPAAEQGTTPDHGPYERVFVEMERTATRSFQDGDVAGAVRYPGWMLYPGSLNDEQLLLISTENKDAFAARFQQSARGSAPRDREAHIIYAGANFDAAELIEHEQDVTQRSTELLLERSIINPSVTNRSFFVEGTWSVGSQTGALSADDFVLEPTRGAGAPDPQRRTRYIRLVLPVGAPDPTVAPVRVQFTLRSATGPFKGWSFGPHSVVIRNGVTAVYANGIIVHEIGHSLGQTPAPGEQPAGLVAHPRYYTGRGGQGPHCHTAAGDTDGVLVDVSGQQEYAWNSGICVMFHRAHSAGYIDFCATCRPYLLGQDMTKMKSA
ncbi:hypothetical protein HPC49_01250 [Pyxidicoccus fallax]|uniref:Uncharacterized protein n=1 Tax=Pyxidicoccus fallax TaxID=394095 RepID=A0A848L4K3_9BACT|nr:hypothetical protein [Pyxidicoccus fallax]NMO13589.1 hypothetical protein [Pyxidicoccus fallax]NPC76880.1 hypothetical protein [Pyxidicoccus fallax]